jgi:hypothetical protein
MQNKDKRVNWKGDPYTFQDDGFSWDFKDSELIDFYTNKESGKINWKHIEGARNVRDGYLANEQWDKNPRFTTSQDRGYADLDKERYNYGENNELTYPVINQSSSLSPEDKFMESY